MKGQVCRSCGVGMKVGGTKCQVCGAPRPAPEAKAGPFELPAALQRLPLGPPGSGKPWKERKR